MKLKKYFLFAVIMLLGVFTLASCGDEEEPEKVDCSKNPNHEQCKGPDGPVDPEHTHKYVDGVCSCGAKDPNYSVADPNLNCALDRNNEACLDPATWNWDYNKDNWDGKGMEIEIMVLPVAEHDPGNADYKGERKQEKRNLIAKVESEYNIDIVYKDYPAEAPWGPERVKWISNGVAAGNDVGDIFLIDSSWVPTLQRNSAIAELYNLGRGTGIFTEYNYVQADNYNIMARTNNKVYAYAAGDARPDHWLHYNQALIEQYNLPDPAKLWNAGEWTWSAFMDLLETAQAAFDQDSEKGKKYAFGGDQFEAAKGFVAARGGQFVKNGIVLLENSTILQVYEDLQVISDLYWEPKGGTTSSAEFRDGLVLFQTGSMWFYGAAERWPATLDFGISAVPYPRSDDDANLDKYQIPVGYESMLAIRNVVNGENGLNASILFNIIDDITNGLKPESASTALSPREKYYAYLEARIDSKDSIDAIMGVVFDHPELTYFEMINVISMSLGDGSHYGNPDVCLYPVSTRLIGNSDLSPAVVLGGIKSAYQQKLDELLAG